MIVETILNGAFSKEELAYLRRDLRFATALERVYSVEDVKRLRDIGHEVLAERNSRKHRAHHPASHRTVRAR
jgi:hypothetical protein